MQATVGGITAAGLDNPGPDQAIDELVRRPDHVDQEHIAHVPAQFGQVDIISARTRPTTGTGAPVIDEVGKVGIAEPQVRVDAQPGFDGKIVHSTPNY